MADNEFMNLPERPKLRMVEPMWVEHMGQRFLHLRDPMALSDMTIMAPEAVAPLLALLDGTRSLAEIRSGAALRFGLSLTEANVRSLVGQLDKALMIENGEYRRAHRRALDEYRGLEFRRPAHAGAVYPRAAHALASAIDDWGRRFPAESSAPSPGGDLVGMVCPHIDFERGHATYAKLWQQAEPDLSDVELAIVLGTDHSGGLGRITLTRQSYATPYGALRTDADVVDRLARSLGREAFEEELHHVNEHSIELALVWLHHFTRDMDIGVVPILCGSFHEFTNGDALPDEDSRMMEAAEIVAHVARRRRTLIVAAGDLAHVGPAFGDERALDEAAKSGLRTEDAASIRAICSGDADEFLALSRAESDRRKICGLPPIYLMLRALEGAAGAHMGYDQCPADSANGSVVSIVGALLYR